MDNNNATLASNYQLPNASPHKRVTFDTTPTFMSSKRDMGTPTDDDRLPLVSGDVCTASEQSLNCHLVVEPKTTLTVTPTPKSTATRLTMIFAIMAVLGRSLLSISVPVWLDFFKQLNQPALNITPAGRPNPPLLPLYPSTPTFKHTDVIFVFIGQLTFSTTLITIAVIMHVLCTRDLTRWGPTRYMLLAGVCQGISTIIFGFSSSGARTAPYLQILLGNCAVPIQFVVRFVVLRKRPTCLKAMCAAVVLLAELLCLLPSIFPSLETSEQHHSEGGAHGVGAILWPMAYVFAQVPYAVANVALERDVQRPSPSHQGSIKSMLVVMWWWCIFALLTMAALFWTDLIPGFGTSSTPQELAKAMLFDLQCLFGTNCPPKGTVFGWVAFLAHFIGVISFVALMRFSEGSSFLVIILTTRTPLVFFFWTMFQEQPLQWHPHVALSTWLSIAGLFIMLPAIFIYSLGLPRIPCKKNQSDVDEESKQLLSPSIQSNT